jgi:5-hydroxyisourate hydrolase-like protein (transthyretin family)
MRRSLLPLLAIVAALVAGAVGLQQRAIAASTFADVEPNNTCSEAQNLGPLNAPLTVTGSLDGLAYPGPYPPPSAQLNLDYFRISAPAGTLLQIDLRGSGSGGGSLSDPFLGAFNSACSQLGVADYGGSSFLDARLTLGVPEDGVLVIAATSCCDYNFMTGGFGSGSYTLEVQELQTAESIAGRAVDGRSGAPLSFVGVSLERCESGSCSFVAGGQSDSQGRFSFVNRVPGVPYPEPVEPPPSELPSYTLLTVGEYRVRIEPLQYEPYVGPIVSLGAGQALDLGDLPVQPVPLIGSVSGRLVDAASGEPLSGDFPTNAFVVLQRCEQFGCSFAAQTPANSDGSFSFRPGGFQPLSPGDYIVSYSANQYISGQTAQFSVAEGEDIDLGAIAVQSRPVRIAEITPCPPSQAQGGRCDWTARLVNGQRSSARLVAWATYTSFNSSSFISSNFQAQVPQQFALRPGESRVVRFRIEIPPDLPAGTTVCSSVYGAADTRAFYFKPSASGFGFCLFKQGDGSFRQLTQDEQIDRMLQLRGVPREQRGRR